MEYRWTFRLLVTLVALAASTVRAEDVRKVHVREVKDVAGVKTQISDEIRVTGMEYASSAAPAVDGHVFIGWTASQGTLAARDRHGRARETVRYVPTDAMTLTAHYVVAAVDTVGDGVSDGLKLYWYGDLNHGAMSDTDGDGFTLAQEIAAGTNPLLPDRSVNGGVWMAEGTFCQYNPLGALPIVVRSEPEGALFETTTNYLARGQQLTTPAFDGGASAFSYWTVNGVRAADRRGRAHDSVTVTATGERMEVVAVTVANAAQRAQLYWYGTSQSLDSDTDGDGLTFEQELKAGTNPLLPDRTVVGGVFTGEGNLVSYNVSSARLLTVRSDPEGALFETVSEYVPIGQSVGTSIVRISGETFACWMTNGVRVVDRRGRAKDSFDFLMPAADVELVAVSVEDEEERAQLYWYGSPQALDSDTDGDGLTFRQELSGGTNPLLADRTLTGGVYWRSGAEVEVDLQREPTDPVDGPGGTNTVSYVGLEGAVNTNVTEFTTNDLPLVLGPVERAGWKFLGWTPNGGVIPVGTVTNVTFTANWEEIDEPPPAIVDEAATHVDVESGEEAPFAAAAAVYDGYLQDGETVVGSVQVKVAKGKKDKSGVFSAKVTATVRLVGEAKVLDFKGGVADAEGRVTEMTDKSGRKLMVSVGVNGLGGTLLRIGDGAPCLIDGTRNFFGGKTAEDKSAAAEAVRLYQGTYNAAFDGGTLSVTVDKRGRAKVTGTVDGNKVSATSPLLVGEGVAAIPVVIVKKVNLSFCLWLTEGGTVVVRGATTGASPLQMIAGRPDRIEVGAKFLIEDGGATGARVLPGLYADCLPDGVKVAQVGMEWVVANGAKAGKLVLLDKETGALDSAKSKFTDNTAGLKLAYKWKDGTFTGSFKAYAFENGKIKSYTANVTGVMIGRTGYGLATVKKIGSMTVTISKVDSPADAPDEPVGPDEDLVLGGVQLWENGPYWAECNVGATKPETSGYYFWWGDTVGCVRAGARWDAVDGSWSGFSFCEENCATFGKNDAQLQTEGVIDETGNLAAEYDAATAHLGAPWRMPTDAEFAALEENCTTTWTMRNGAYGRLVTGKGAYASHRIFLPAAGNGSLSNLNDFGSDGGYWSSTPDSGASGSAWRLAFNSSDFRRSQFRNRDRGRSVRPVRRPANESNGGSR